MLNMEEYLESETVREIVTSMSGAPPSNEPSDRVSSTITVRPFNQFAGAQREATIMIQVDETSARDGTQIFRASPNNGWIYVPLETEIVNGMAVARTNRGGVFVVAVAVTTGIIVGVVITLIILSLIASTVIGLYIYFRQRPEKLKSTKDTLAQTQSRVKRSFAKQV